LIIALHCPEFIFFHLPLKSSLSTRKFQTSTSIAEVHKLMLSFMEQSQEFNNEDNEVLL